MHPLVCACSGLCLSLDCSCKKELRMISVIFFFFLNASSNTVLEMYNFPAIYPQYGNLHQYVRGFLHCAQRLNLASL